MRRTRYITIVEFTAFDRRMREAFVDDELVMMYNIRRRVKNICNTARIIRIEYYEGSLVNTETFDQQAKADPSSRFKNGKT